MGCRSVNQRCGGRAIPGVETSEQTDTMGVIPNWHPASGSEAAGNVTAQPSRRRQRIQKCQGVIDRLDPDHFDVVAGGFDGFVVIR